MTPFPKLALLPLCILLASCSSTQLPMRYAPTAAVVPTGAPRPVVALRSLVANERRTGREDPTWVGTIRGGFGNPLKALHAEAPVDQVVGRAFADGLAARGLRAAREAEARYALAVTIHEFDANQYIRREATADFGAVLTERATGREVWRDRHRAYNVDGSIVAAAGVFASTEDLQRVATRTMNEAVDALLDKPGFRAALQNYGAGVVARTRSVTLQVEPE
jgi:uncharacterized lipoprotein YajG